MDPALTRAYTAPARDRLPAIQLGRCEGRMLGMFARLIGAKRAVEVGTLAGFSAIELARGLAPGGRLWTIEADHHHATVARGNLTLAGLGGRVTVLEGTGAAMLPTLAAEGPFDLVFLDADKEGYPIYGRWAREHLRPGGLLIADNVHLFGELLDEGLRPTLMRQFHEEAAEAFDTTVVPTSDGLLVGIRR
jgi:caffeoyl-CoA O-methyltransferase